MDVNIEELAQLARIWLDDQEKRDYAIIVEKRAKAVGMIYNIEEDVCETDRRK